MSGQTSTKLIHAYVTARYSVTGVTEKKIYQKGQNVEFRYNSITKIYICRFTGVVIDAKEWKKYFHHIKVTTLIDTTTKKKESWRHITPHRYHKLENGKDTANPKIIISSKVVGRGRRYLHGVKADFPTGTGKAKSVMPDTVETNVPSISEINTACNTINKLSINTKLMSSMDIWTSVINNKTILTIDDNSKQLGNFIILDKSGDRITAIREQDIADFNNGENVDTKSFNINKITVTPFKKKSKLINAPYTTLPERLFNRTGYIQGDPYVIIGSINKRNIVVCKNIATGKVEIFSHDYAAENLIVDNKPVAKQVWSTNY